MFVAVVEEDGDRGSCGGAQRHCEVTMGKEWLFASEMVVTLEGDEDGGELGWRGVAGASEEVVVRWAEVR